VVNAIKALGIVVGVASTAFFFQARPGNSAEVTSSDYTVTLHFEKDILISKMVAQELESDVVEIMKTANYNSRTPPRDRPDNRLSISEVTQGYRKVVANGKYVLIIWACPQKVQTVGGEVTTCETILALELPGAWMFNVDDEGRLIHVGKFSGPMSMRLEEFVRKLVKTP
jgi:hypothetical protein